MNKKRILVVDDEPSVTRIVKLNLESTGDYEVLAENVSKNALADARRFRPDLILLDVIMPEPDGCDVAARMHADPLLKDIPIVFLTALASNAQTGGREVVTGSRIYLAKPADVAELTRCIERRARKSLDTHCVRASDSLQHSNS